MFHARFGPRLRHPLVRLLGGILGIVAVLGVLMLGLFAFAALLIGGALWMLFNALRRPRAAAPRTAQAPAADKPGVIDGEFTVLRNQGNHSGVPR